MKGILETLRVKEIHNDAEKRQIMAICRSAFADADEYARAYAEDKIEKVCSHAEFFGAFSNGEPCGYLAIYANNAAEHVAYVTELAVRPEYQRSGVGQALWDAGVAASVRAGMKHLRLEVRNTNEPARRFYQKNGLVFEKAAGETRSYLFKEL